MNTADKLKLLTWPQFHKAVEQARQHLDQFTHEEGGFIMIDLDTKSCEFVTVANGLTQGQRSNWEPGDEAMSTVFEFKDEHPNNVVVSVHNHPFWAAFPSTTDRSELFQNWGLNLIYSNKTGEFNAFDEQSHLLAKLNDTAVSA